MPIKYTVTVDKNNKLVYPQIGSFIEANQLLTAETLPGAAVDKLKLKCTGEDKKIYQVELSVSINKIGEGANAELIPQINLSIVEEED